jgi:hypothetical protein
MTNLTRQFNTYKQHVQDTHGDMVGQVDNVEHRLGIPLCILTLLVHPWANGMPTMTMQQYQAAIHLLFGNGLFNSLGVYNKIQCAVMQKMRTYVAVVDAVGERPSLTEINPTPATITNLGRLCISASSALMLKYAWLRWAQAGQEYYGRMPVTSPVKNYWLGTYGYVDPHQGEVDAVTHQIAQEIGWAAMDVNTAMWLMGLE